MLIRFLASAALCCGLSPVVSRAADLGLPQAVQCADHILYVSANTEEAHLRIGGTWRTFIRTETASGAKYVAAEAADQWLWNKGKDYTVSLPETGEITCTASEPPSASFSATGIEPGWRLVFADDVGTLATMNGSVTLGHVSSVETVAGGRRISFTQASVNVLDVLCHDAATGMPYPHSVVLTSGDTTMTGCGGNPLDLLAGLDWHIATANGGPVAEGADAVIRFDGDGNFSGKAGCNSMRGSIELTGEGMSFGPQATTRMMCQDTWMDTEQRVLGALAEVSRFDFAADGALHLLAGDQTVIEARP